MLLIRIHRHQNIANERIRFAELQSILHFIQQRIIRKWLQSCQIFHVHLLHLVIVCLNVSLADHRLILQRKIDRLDVFLEHFKLLRKLKKSSA